MAAIAKSEIQSSPAPQTFKEAMAKNQCQLTQNFLKKSDQIANRILEDNQSWAKVYDSLSTEQVTLLFSGAALGLLYEVASLRLGEPSLFGTVFKGGVAALPSFMSAGKNSGNAHYANTKTEQMNKALPEMKKELEQAGISGGEIGKISSIFEREIKLLQIVNRNEEKKFNSKLGIGYSAAAWTLGTAIGIPILPALSLITGSFAACFAAAQYGVTSGLNPSAEAEEIQTEIKQLGIR